MMTKSTVVDNETGKSVDSTVRTSTGTFFARGQDHTIAEVEKRIAMVSSCAVHTRFRGCCCHVLLGWVLGPGSSTLHPRDLASLVRLCRPRQEAAAGITVPLAAA